MTFVEIRNTIAKKLEDYLGVPGDLADQIQPMLALPFWYFSVTTSYISTGELGEITTTPNDDGITVTTSRREQPSATFSFTFCSVDRDDGGGGYIYGENEAASLAERAQGFFLHVGRDDLSNLGIVVADISNVSNRTTLVINEAARRYGFDVRFRYSRVDARTDGTVDVVAVNQIKE